MDLLYKKSNDDVIVKKTWRHKKNFYPLRWLIEKQNWPVQSFWLKTLNNAFMNFVPYFITLSLYLPYLYFMYNFFVEQILFF